MNIKRISFTMFFLFFIPFNLSAAAAKRVPDIVPVRKQPRTRSPLYKPLSPVVQESDEVIQQKKEIEKILEHSLRRCLKYRALAAKNCQLKEGQLKLLDELKLKIELLRADLESDELQAKLHIKDTIFLDRCYEILQEVALVENGEVASNLSDGTVQRRNSKYAVVSGVTLACLGGYVLKKRAAFKEKQVVACEPGAVPLTEEEKKARAKKLAVSWVKKYKPTTGRDALELWIAAVALVFGIVF